MVTSMNSVPGNMALVRERVNHGLFDFQTIITELKSFNESLNKKAIDEPEEPHFDTSKSLAFKEARKAAVAKLDTLCTAEPVSVVNPLERRIAQFMQHKKLQKENDAKRSKVVSRARLQTKTRDIPMNGNTNAVPAAPYSFVSGAKDDFSSQLLFQYNLHEGLRG